MATADTLKRGSLGDIRIEADGDRHIVVRDLKTARAGWVWLARHLARREAAALSRLSGLTGIPALLSLDRDRLTRSHLAGLPMHAARPASRAFYREALRLLRRIHRQGVAHNDLAKEANWIRCDDGLPAIVDFQLALCSRHRGRWFRLLAREDLRHWLKHKATYRPDTLTARQRQMLAQPSWATRFWRRTFRPAYRIVTRRLLGWPERDGPAERERRTTD